MARQSRITTFGPHVLDLRAIAHAGQSQTGSKRTCEFQLTDGGGAVNVAKKLQWLGEHVSIAALIGRDEMGKLADARLQQQFSNLITIPAFENHRISVLQGDQCLTSRPASEVKAVPAEVRRFLQKSRCVIVAPMTDEDFPLLSDLLQGARRSRSQAVLQLSSSQIQHPEHCFALMRLATVTIINDSEARSLFQKERMPLIVEDIQKLRLGNVVITSASDVHAWLDGNYFIVPTCPVETVVQTVGAGDVFTAAFAAVMLRGDSWNACLRNANRSAAEHISGVKMNEALVDRVRPILPTPHHPSGLRRAAMLLVSISVIAILEALLRI